MNANRLKILMISMDNSILNSQSESWERMQFYASVFDELVIIVLNSKGSVKHSGNVTVYPTSRNKPLSFLKAITIGRKLLRNNKFNLISTQDPFFTGLIGYILKLEFGLCLQFQIHTGLFTPYFWLESEKNRVYVRLARILLPRADCVKVVSEGIKNYLIENLKINASKISVLPVYTSFERFENGEIMTSLRERYPQFDFVVLMASRLVKQKNISLAIRALKPLVERHPGIGLVIVGSGPDEENLKREAQELNIEHNVQFVPWTDDIVSYYKTSDLFLLTSNYEGWARTILEAMAAGLPTIITGIYIGVATEAIENGVNGIVVPVGDEVAVTAAIEELYNDKQKRESISKAARETIARLHFKDREEYLRLYVESFNPCCSIKI